MKKILLVDKDLQTRASLRQQLSEKGYEISEAENGQKALEKIKNELPEVVLLDSMLPDMTGFQLCQQVLSTPQSDLMYFIMMTTVPKMDHKLRGVAKGADAYIAKPVDMTELFTQIHEGFEKISEQRETIMDPVTKLYNHNFFRIYLAQEVSRAQRYNHPLAFIMGTIDHPDRSPDNSAQWPDKKVVAELGEILRKHCRRSDIPVRWDEETFAVLAHETDLMGGMMLAERIRQTIQTHKFVAETDITMSFGVASLKANKENLVKWAQASLEKAQQTGGNKVLSTADD